jgi:hypothetical protein
MTTDWTKQAEDMVKNWTSVQQKMMESMMGMMGISNASSPVSKDVWDKTINTWHESMKSALESQVAWTQFMADSVAANTGTNKQISEMSQQAVDMMKRWSETQSKVLDTWLEEVKKTDPSDLSKSMKPEEMLKSVQSWQEAGRKMMESQMEMMRSFTTATTDAAKKK